MIELSNSGKLKYRNIRHTLLKFQEHFQENVPQIVKDFVYSPDIDDWRVVVYKTDDKYDYMISLTRVSSGEQYESTHIDGIQQERDINKSSIPNHPAFYVTCLTDILLEELMDGSSKPIKEDEKVVNGWGR